MMSISHTLFKKKVARSVGGDIVLVLFLALMGLLMILPFVYTISTSLKPNFSSENYIIVLRALRGVADAVAIRAKVVTLQRFQQIPTSDLRSSSE